MITTQQVDFCNACQQMPPQEDKKRQQCHSYIFCDACQQTPLLEDIRDSNAIVRFFMVPASKSPKKSIHCIAIFCIFLRWHLLARTTKNLTTALLFLGFPMTESASMRHKISNYYIAIFCAFLLWLLLAGITKNLTITLLSSVSFNDGFCQQTPQKIEL